MLNLHDYVAADGTDENLAIQAVFDFAAAEDQAVYAGPGTYGITGLAIPSDFELYGDGDLTVFKVLPTTGNYPFANTDNGTTGVSNVHLHDFAIDGNKANIPGDPEVQGAPRLAIFFSSDATHQSENITVERVHVYDSKRLGIVFQRVKRGAIRDCLVERNDRDGITVYFNSEDIEVTGNRVFECGDDYIGLNGGEDTVNPNAFRNIVVTDNILRGPGQRNKGKGICVRGGSGLLLADNVIDDVSEDGIMLRDFQTTALTNVVARSNVITRVGTAGVSGHGVRVLIGAAADHPAGFASGRAIVIEENVIDTTVETGIALRSEHAAGELSGVAIRKNVIASAGTDGVVLSTGLITDVEISDNVIVGTADNGIVSGASTNRRLRVAGNTVRDGAASGSEAAIRIENADTCWVTNNETYDARAVPAQANGLRLLANTGASSVIRDNASFGNTGVNYAVTSTVASAAALTLPAGRLSRVLVTGTADITSIAATAPDHRVTLVFAGAAATNGVVDGGNLRLAGNFPYTVDDTLTLICDGTTWQEVARSVN